MRVYAFDDDLGDLSPLTDLRPSFEVRTGAMTALERLTAVVGGDRLVELLVPDRLAATTAETHGHPVNDRPRGTEAVLLVNGRWVLPDRALLSLGPGQALVEEESSGIMAACVPASGIDAVLAGDATGLEPRVVEGRQLLSKPWHVRAVRDEAIRRDLGHLTGLPDGPFGATIDPSARVHASAVLDTDQGHIVIAAGATVRPGAIIIGPAYVGPGSTVLDNAVIRGPTAIGPMCRVGGEVAGTIFQGYANKAHHGFLGDSWVGAWVNLGAGTVNSNLLNTYGEIVAQAPGGHSESTGEQFLGAVIGDHVKTAINTRIMAGAIVGTGTMWAATAPITGCVSAFTWATDADTQQFRLNKFIETARAMMVRRNVEPSRAYVQRVEELHASSPAQ